MKSLNVCSQVTAHKMLPEEFRDWDESFDLIHSDPKNLCSIEQTLLPPFFPSCSK